RLLQAPVTRPEVMPPLADAVRLVHGEQRDVRMADVLEEAGAFESLGGNIKNREPPFARLFQACNCVVKIDERVDGRGPYPRTLKSVYLVLHQGDEWRDDNGESAGEDRRHLVAGRLPAARGQYGKRIALREHRGDNLRLTGAEIIVAE